MPSLILTFGQLLPSPEEPITAVFFKVVLPARNRPTRQVRYGGYRYQFSPQDRPCCAALAVIALVEDILVYGELSTTQFHGSYCRNVDRVIINWKLPRARNLSL